MSRLWRDAAGGSPGNSPPVPRPILRTVPETPGMLHKRRRILKLVAGEKDKIQLVLKIIAQKEHMKILTRVHFIRTPGIARRVSVIQLKGYDILIVNGRDILAEDISSIAFDNILSMPKSPICHSSRSDSCLKEALTAPHFLSEMSSPPRTPAEDLRETRDHPPG